MAKLFSHNGIYINERTFEVEGQQYENRLIGRIFYPEAQTPALSEILINGGGFLVGLYGIFTFKTIWIVIGLVVCGICGYNIYDMINIFKNPKYVVMINMKPSSNILRLTFNNKQNASDFCQILETQRESAILAYESED